MNPIVRKMSPTATNLIRMDHAHVSAQFHRLDADTEPAVRAAVIRSICAALQIHAQIEDELFYPALREAGVQSPALDKSVPEHDEMRRLIGVVRSLDDQPGAQDDAVNGLINAVLHHMADEETNLLPAAEKVLGHDRLADLGARMTERKLELAKPRAAEFAADMFRGAPAKTALLALGALAAGTVLVKALRRNRWPRYS